MRGNDVGLIERERPLRRLGALLRGTGTVVVQVCGPPGIGRSALLRRQIAHERARGVRLAVARCLPGDVTRECGVVEEVGAALSVAAAAGTVDSVLPATGPVVLVLDDAQWCDPESVEWLGSVLGRAVADEADLAVVLATHGAGTPAEERFAELAALDSLTSPPWHRITLSPLTPSGVGALMSAAGPAEVEATLAGRLATASGGIPAVLREAIAETGDVRKLPAALEAAVGRRVVRVLGVLPRPDLAVLRVVAAARGQFGLSLLADLAEVGRGEAGMAVRRLAEWGLVEPGGRPRVRSPAVAHAALAGLDEQQRAALRSAAVEACYRTAAPMDTTSAVLLDAPPTGNSWVRTLLGEQAQNQLRNGRLEEAEMLLERALAEPAEPPARAADLITAAQFELSRRGPGRSDRWLAQVVADDDPAVAPYRVRAVDMLTCHGRHDLARRLIERSIGRPGCGDEERHALTALYWLALDGAGEPGDRHLPMLPPLPADPADPARRGMIAWRLAMRATDRERALVFARSAVAAGRGTPLILRVASCQALDLGDDVEAARSACDELLVVAGREGATAALAHGLLVRAQLCLRLGRLDEVAADLARITRDLPEPSRSPVFDAHCVLLNVWLALLCGELGRAETAVRSVTIGPADGVLAHSRWLFADALVRLCRGQAALAGGLLRECGRHLLAGRLVNPGALPWRSFAALAARNHGERAEAERLLAEEQALLAEWGAPLLAATAADRAAVVRRDRRSPAEDVRSMLGSRDREGGV